MSKIEYTNYKCPYCGELFKESDDIVVCPECGTPMHRSCYEENDGCPNAEKHGEYDFNTDSDIKKENNNNNTYNDNKDTVTCQKCGTENRKETFFCQKCGSPLGNQNNNQSTYQNTPPFGNFNNQNPNQQMPFDFMDPLGGIPKDTKLDDDITADEMAKYVKVNTPYFSRVFNNIVSFNKSKFNFAAALFSGGYLLYRKMYKVGAVIASIQALILIFLQYINYTLITAAPYVNVINKVNNLSQKGSILQSNVTELQNIFSSLTSGEMFILCLPSILEICMIIFMIVMGFTTNRIYFNHCKKQIHKIKSKSNELSNTDIAINQKGGVNTALAATILVVYLVIMYLPGFLIF